MNALARLVAETRALAGTAAADGMPRGVDCDYKGPAPLLTPLELRRRVAALLSRLAAQVSDELPQALALARTAWDQADAVTLVDSDAWHEARQLRAAARALAAGDDDGARAEAVAAGLTLDAAVGVAALVERRLATLLRLGGDAAFLALGAALTETARAWA
jgi:hypothetical protein